MSNPAQPNILAEYDIIDQRALKVLEQIVKGLDNAIEDIQVRVETALQNPGKLFLLPMVCKKTIGGYAQAYNALAEFAAKYLFCIEHPTLSALGYNFDRELIRYKAQVNKVYGTFAKDPHELLISLQFRIKEALLLKKRIEAKPEAV